MIGSFFDFAAQPTTILCALCDENPAKVLIAAETDDGENIGFTRVCLECYDGRPNQS